MKPKILLSINRYGSFTILPSQFCGPQCGSTNMTDYEYRVKIEAYDTRLIEPEMFVLDNEHVTEYFDRKYLQERCEVRSCEVIAQDAISYFLSLFIGPRAIYGFIDIQRIKVWVRGSEVSFITGEWKKPEQMLFQTTSAEIKPLKFDVEHILVQDPYRLEEMGYHHKDGVARNVRVTSGVRKLLDQVRNYRFKPSKK